MHTRPFVHVAAALAVAALAVAAARPAAAGPAAAVTTFTLRDTIAYGRAAAVAPAYGWPVKPFDRQHPVRAFLDDPRIGREGGESFHFGIDVAAPDGTPVYAVAAGELYLSHGSLCVVAQPGHIFGYWHVRAAAGLREGQAVRRHQRLGTIAPGWGHVHFDERIGPVYVNPLRPGALGPYTDPVAPTVSSLSVLREGRSVALVVRAHDTTWPPVPGAWAREPVSPALLRWRLGTGGWHVAADFRQRVLGRHAFASIYAPGTRQNHEGAPGTFAFYLTRSWHPVDGTYRLQVQAADTRGNRSTAEVQLAFAHGEVLP